MMVMKSKTAVRGINSDLFKKWLKEHENGAGHLLEHVRCSMSTILLISCGHYNDGRAPSPILRKAFCNAMELQEEDLFPALDA